MMAALARPDTLIQQLEPAAGPYMNGNDTSSAATRRRHATPWRFCAATSPRS